MSSQTMACSPELVAPFAEESGARRRREQCADVHERAQQSRGRAHAGGIGLR
ncbi:hypothetical protein [Streptomyces sp. NEAU-174]|uniref:hypothetical protein n=1 Tax=Streptomyces sp. NEAU-174 TaxID=3458254 RepID=UPI004043AE58